MTHAMNASELRPGLYRVRHTDESGSFEFNLSVRDCYGLYFVAGFKDGEKPPWKSEHLMLTDNVREWIGAWSYCHDEAAACPRMGFAPRANTARLCHGAYVDESLASQPWKRIAIWLRVLIADSLKARSRGRCELKP